MKEITHRTSNPKLPLANPRVYFSEDTEPPHHTPNFFGRMLAGDAVLPIANATQWPWTTNSINPDYWLCWMELMGTGVQT